MYQDLQVLFEASNCTEICRVSFTSNWMLSYKNHCPSEDVSLSRMFLQRLLHGVLGEEIKFPSNKNLLIWNKYYKSIIICLLWYGSSG